MSEPVFIGDLVMSPAGPAFVVSLDMGPRVVMATVALTASGELRAFPAHAIRLE